MHVIDISESEGRNSIQDFEDTLKELYGYNKKLRQKKMIIVGNKCDQASNEQIKKFENYIKSKNYDFFVISSIKKYQTENLIKKISNMLKILPKVKIFQKEDNLEETFFLNEDKKINIKIKNKTYFVESNIIKKILESIDINYKQSFAFFEKILVQKGVIKALKLAGANKGDLVDIYGIEFNFNE